VTQLEALKFPFKSRVNLKTKLELLPKILIFFKNSESKTSAGPFAAKPVQAWGGRQSQSRSIVKNWPIDLAFVSVTVFIVAVHWILLNIQPGTRPCSGHRY
jgi:hypothetical protein